MPAAKRWKEATSCLSHSRRIGLLWLPALGFACLSVLQVGAAGAEEQTAPFDTESDLTGWTVSGDAKIDTEQKRGGAGSLRLSPGGKAVWKLRDTDGSGKVEMWVREDGAKPADPKQRRIGPRWGLIQADGRVLVIGIIYAPYLAGDQSYACSDSENQKDWFVAVQHLRSERDDQWSQWAFDFDPEKGLSIHRNGKPIKRFDWAKTKIGGFCGVALFGDTGAEPPHTIWVDDVTASLGGPMKVAPTSVPPSPRAAKRGKASPSSASASALPDKDPPVENPVRLAEAVRGRHPRLLFASGDIPALKERAAGPSKAFFDRMVEYLGSCSPPQDEKYTQNATEAQRRGMWQAPTVAIHYAMTGDKASFEKGKAYLERFMASPHWETGKEPDSGMGAANVMVGAAILYDCLYSGLDPQFREAVRQRLLLQARRMYYGGHLQGNPGTHYWQQDPQNNHRFHRLAGLTLCALAAAEEGRPEDDWIVRQAYDELAFIHQWLPEDGSYHDSPSYMIFGTVYLVTAFEASDRCFGTDYLSHPFFRENIRFRLHTLTPGFKHVFYYGDSGGRGFFNNYLFRCASKHRASDLQAGLTEFERVDPDAFAYGWASLLWFDPALPLGALDKIAKTQLFPDLGEAFMRDGWTERDVAAFFKCGPPGGYKLNQYRNERNFQYINVAHDHPDANSFQIFAGGEILATDDGYPKAKQTRAHNTILVNGKGQKTDAPGFSQPLKNVDMTKLASLVAWKDAGDVAIVEGEAGGLYSALTRFRRALVWVRGGYALVMDDIRAKQEAELTWLLHSPALETLDEPGRRFLMKKDAAQCAVQILSNLDVSIGIEKDMSDQHGETVERGRRLEATAKAPAWRVVAVFNPWNHPTLACEARGLDSEDSTLTIRGPGFEDTWTWQAAADRDAPSTLHGRRNGGFEVSLGAGDKAGG